MIVSLSGLLVTVATIPGSDRVQPLPNSRGATAYPSGDEMDTIGLNLAQVNAEPGEYWLVTEDGKDPWPCVICDEDMVTRLFKGNQRPDNARRPDGTWHKSLLPHGKLAGQKCFPVLYLATLKFRWASWNRLKPFDFIAAFARKNDLTLHTILRQAYGELLFQHELDYWKSEVLARSLQFEENAVVVDNYDRGMTEFTPGPSNGARKRKRGHLRALEVDEPVDDDESHLFKKEPESTLGGLHSGYDDLYDVSDQEGRTNRLKAKKSRTAVHSLTQILTPPITPEKATKQKIGDDKVRIYVGNPHQEFVVRKSGIAESHYLLSMLKDENGEACIMSRALSSLQPANFTSVAEYLDHSEYKPNLLDEYTDYARLEKVETLEQSSEALYNCAVLYGMGQELELPALQDLVLRKVRVLQPYAADDFVMLAKLVYRFGPPADKSFHDFLVDYTAEHFFKFWQEESTAFAELLQENKELARGIFKRMAGLMKAESITTEKEVEKKDEEETLFTT